jgi:hypothetical protein
MTHQEAGKRGGTATLVKYGTEYLRVLGNKGGRPRLPTLEQAETRHQTTVEKEEIEIKRRRLPATLPAMKRLWFSIQKNKELAALSSATPKEGN